VLTIGDPKKPAETTFTFDPIAAPKDAFKASAGRLDFVVTTSSDDAVGLDLHVDPPTAQVEWKLTFDGKPWPEQRVFVGPFGLAAQAAKLGLTSDEARYEVYSPQIAEIDLEHDLGLFVTRDRRAEANAPDIGGEGAQEFSKLLEQWGYAHSKKKTAPPR
jgi:hypothetical protein